MSEHTLVSPTPDGYEIFKRRNSAGGTTYYKSEVGQEILNTALTTEYDLMIVLIDVFRERLERYIRKSRNDKPDSKT